MAWSFKWAEHIDSGFYYSLLASGKLKEEDLEPEIAPFSFYVEAFRELSSCRQLGMGVGPIPFTALVEYSKIFEVGDFEEFCFLIRAMDDKYLTLEYSKTVNKSKSAQKASQKKR